MNTLLSHLASSIKETLDLVLYIGAGSSVDLAEFGPLRPRQFVLVEGDPHLAVQLARSLATERSCRVEPTLVTPDGAKCTLYRYNLPFLNGVMPLGELGDLYPRLKIVDELETGSTTLTALIKSIPLQGDGKRLLILDVPGQEAALLNSLDPGHIREFEWILLRACRNALQPTAQPATVSTSRLEAMLFDQVFRDDESDPAWPVTLFRFDRRMGEIHLEMENRTRLLTEMTQENEQKSRQILELETCLQASKGELDGAREQLGALAVKLADAEEAKRLAVEERERWITPDKGAADSAHMEAQIASLISQIDHLREQLNGLDSQLSERGALLSAATDRLANLENDLAPQKMLIEVLTKGRSQQDALCQNLEKERDGLRAEIKELNARRIELEGLLAGKETHGKLIDMEFQKVEGQIDLIKDIFLRERR